MSRGAHVINPSLRANLPYDTVKDLSGVTQVNEAHLVLAAHPSVEAGNVAEIIELARRDPGKLSYATPGSGTAMHLAMEQLKIAAGIDLVHVAYKGGAPALQDVLSGGCRSSPTCSTRRCRTSSPASSRCLR
jgi:tripartite-type tricarboxylate transporter receptor subunit TctC